MPVMKKPDPDPGMRPERINTRIHTAGVLIGVVAFPFLINYALTSQVKQGFLSAIIYGICFLLTFTLSSLFHKSRVQPRRSFLKLLDRISIYFLIAGTYTPLITWYMQSATGTALLISLWSLVAFGVFFEIYLVKKYILISVPLYILMGCLFVFTASRFFAEMPTSVITLVLAGVFLYLIGTIFYLREKWEYNHAIWHVFVLFAACCHYTAILITAQHN